MSTFSELELNSSESLYLSGVGHLRCPTARDVVRLRELTGGNQDGESVYNLYLDILLRTKAQFLESISSAVTESELKMLDLIPLFELYLMFDSVRELLFESLEFFMDESVAFDEENRRIVLYRPVTRDGIDTIDEVGAINTDNFVYVKNAILERNYIVPPKDSNGKRRSKKMIEFDKKIEAGRAKSKKYRDNQKSMQLGNIISKCAGRLSLSLNEIYDMTIYQIYGQFFELHGSMQIDAMTTRWCVWGQDKYDFSQWYKSAVEK